MKGKSLQKALIGGGFTRARARVGAGVAELIEVVVLGGEGWGWISGCRNDYPRLLFTDELKCEPNVAELQLG